MRASPAVPPVPAGGARSTAQSPRCPGGLISAHPAAGRSLPVYGTAGRRRVKWRPRPLQSWGADRQAGATGAARGAPLHRSHGARTCDRRCRALSGGGRWRLAVVAEGACRMPVPDHMGGAYAVTGGSRRIRDVANLPGGPWFLRPRRPVRASAGPSPHYRRMGAGVVPPGQEVQPAGTDRMILRFAAPADLRGN